MADQKLAKIKKAVGKESQKHGMPIGQKHGKTALKRVRRRVRPAEARRNARPADQKAQRSEARHARRRRPEARHARRHKGRKRVRHARRPRGQKRGMPEGQETRSKACQKARSEA
jgi:hypothetical protein